MTSAEYVRLVTSQYQLSTKMLAWLEANLSLFQDVAACAASFAQAFDLDVAVGAQLDILGNIIGVSRTVPFQPTGDVSPVLDDATYRLLLRAKIAGNHWDGRLQSLIEAWQQILPGSLLIVNDHQDMTVDFYIGASLTSILKDLILNGYILPRPQAVLYNISFAVLPMLGFDRDDEFVAGFDTGKFV